MKVQIMSFAQRLKTAMRASLVHLLASALVGIIVAAVVFLAWYPYPYRELSGGRELFLLIVGIDLVCGPLLTLVLFDKSKSSSELFRDLLLVVLIQLSALGYGVFTVWNARPLFLVMEIDRFKVVAAPDLQGPKAASALDVLTPALKPSIFGPPVVIAIRSPKNEDERRTVLMESVAGGRDYSLRPDFYIAYTGDSARKSLARSKPLSLFLERWPSEQMNATAIASKKSIDITRLTYVPVVGREDWIAILDDQGLIQGFLKGDGF